METAVNGLVSSISERTLILWMLNVKEMMKLARAVGDMNKARKYYCDLAFCARSTKKKKKSTLFWNNYEPKRLLLLK